MLARACGEDAAPFYLQFTAILTVWIFLLSDCVVFLVHEKELVVKPEENKVSCREVIKLSEKSRQAAFKYVAWWRRRLDIPVPVRI